MIEPTTKAIPAMQIPTTEALNEADCERAFRAVPPPALAALATFLFPDDVATAYEVTRLTSSLRSWALLGVVWVFFWVFLWVFFGFFFIPCYYSESKSELGTVRKPKTPGCGGLVRMDL